jgi:hypothetical protein
VDDRQFGYTTQLEKENPGAPGFHQFRAIASKLEFLHEEIHKL